MSVYGGPNIITDGLVVCYDAANKRSYPGTGTSWYDLSGNNTTGTLTNGPTFSTEKLGAIDMAGDNDSVNFTYDLRSNWTYECWVKHDVVSRFAFFGCGPASTNNGLHILYSSNTNILFAMYFNDVNYTVSQPTTTDWYHYVFSYNHSSPYTKQAFRNGVKLTGSGTQNQFTGTGTVRIGATFSPPVVGDFADGKFAIARLYNRILSDEEVLQNYNELRSRFGR